jgi:Zn-dependent protease with chaperone function
VGREDLISARRPFDTTAYRFPRERLILVLTLVAVLLVIVLTATATVCLSLVFVLAMLALSYGFTRSHHRALIEQARVVTPRTMPELFALAQECAARLCVERVQIFVAPAEDLNAYTFGLSSPKVLVLNAPLVSAMDADELRFILGHELGHVRLGHTWLNSLVGGLAGIPSPFLASAVLSMAFLWWNRTCEFSADRAGLLACGDPLKAMSALVKLAAGAEARTSADLERALQRIDAEDDHPLSGLGEALSTHPMTVRRIDELRRFAGSAAYRHLREMTDRNVVLMAR